MASRCLKSLGRALIWPGIQEVVLFGHGRKLESCFRVLDTKMMKNHSPENCITWVFFREANKCLRHLGEVSTSLPLPLLARAVLDLATQLFLCQVFGHLLVIGTKRSS